MKPDRNRMILELPVAIQMAIRLRAVKEGVTTGEVVARAVMVSFPDDFKQATVELAKRKTKCPSP